LFDYAFLGGCWCWGHTSTGISTNWAGWYWGNSSGTC